MMKDETLSRTSPLFWLSLAVSLGVAFIGTTFLISPQTGARVFGVSLNDGPGFVFVYTTGIRDVFCGLVGLPFLFAGQRRAVAWVMLITAIIPIADGIITIKFLGVQPLLLAMHWSSVSYVLILACFPFKTQAAQTGR